jgi:outer membrane protein assembly factor BamE (lipoprotein component of BamABCDE complex)
MPRRRATQRRQTGILVRLAAAVSRNPRKFWGTIAFIIGAPAAIAGFYNYVEPWFYTSHQMTREVADGIKKEDQAKIEALRQAALQAVQRNYAATRDTQLELAEGKRDQTVENIAKWNLELAKATKTNDRDSQEMATKIITALTSIKEKLDAQIKTLTASGSSR